MADFEYTENLQLPYIMAGQAQKHITHNEALRMVDALLQVAILEVGRTEPPTNPSMGSRFVVGIAAIGAWADHDNSIAAWQDGTWVFYRPLAGWVVYALDVKDVLVFDGAQWSTVNGAVTAFGINASADAVNRLAVKSDAVYFSHDDVTPGTGDVRMTLNMANASNTASITLANNWVGHAEIGTSGGTDFNVKVSPNGSDWQNALRIDASSGKVSMPLGLSVQHLQAFKDVTTQTLTVSEAALANWDGEHTFLGDDLTWNAALGECSIGRAGLYMTTFMVSTEISSGSARSDSIAVLQRYDGSAWVNVRGSKARMYNRQAGRGGTTAAWTGLVNFAPGDAVRIAVRIEDGTDEVYVDQASLMIMRL
ncbi:MAG: DUF2793 domain-containing protein [Pseudomonadota bacterium]